MGSGWTNRIVRLVCLFLGIGCLGVAWHLTRIGAAGIEDVPPPFILLSGLGGIGFLCAAVMAGDR